MCERKTLDPQYLPTLLLYYEEEIMGVAYFHGLAAHYRSRDEQHKLRLLGDVERHAARMVEPLLARYRLVPREHSALEALGCASVQAHKDYQWPEFVAHMVRRYPLYMDEFHALERMAPVRDLRFVKMLTLHETAAIEFANREASGDPRSIDTLTRYLACPPPR